MKMYAQKVVTLLLVPILFSIQLISQESKSHNNSPLTAGLIVSPLISQIELKGDAAPLEYKSAAVAGFGVFTAYNWIGLNETFLHLCDSKYKQSKSERYNLDVLITDNTFYNRFSILSIKGTSIASNVDDSRV